MPSKIVQLLPKLASGLALSRITFECYCYLAIENNYPPSITIPHDFQSFDFCVKISSPCENNYPSRTSAPQAKNFGVLYENKYTETKIWRKSPHFLEILWFCVKISTLKMEKIMVLCENKYTKKKIGAKLQFFLTFCVKITIPNTFQILNFLWK